MPARPATTSPFAALLGVCAVAFGVGVVGAFVFDLHRHTCASCGRQWRHLGTFNFGNQNAHTCPGCGTVNWMKDMPASWHALHPHAGVTHEPR